MEKRGLSGVVTAMMMIALAIALIAIVWAVVTTLVQDRLGSVEGCTDIFGKVEFDRSYTCYDSGTDFFVFAVSVKDIELESVTVGIASEGSGNSFTLNSEGVEGNQSLLIGYSGNYPVMPGSNSLLTYNYSLDTSPDSIRISPTINGNNCGETDSVLDIPDCRSLV